MLYRDRMTDEIYDRLMYDAQHQWFGLFVGDSGCGKTTTIRRLASSLDENRYSVLYLADSKMILRTFYNGLLEQRCCEGRDSNTGGSLVRKYLTNMY